MASFVEKTGWRLINAAIGVPVAIGVSRGIAQIWISARPGNPPRRPTEPGVVWSDAAGWAALSAVGVAVGQLVTTRTSATVWRGLTGTEPPSWPTRPERYGRQTARRNRRTTVRADKVLQGQS